MGPSPPPTLDSPIFSPASSQSSSSTVTTTLPSSSNIVNPLHFSPSTSPRSLSSTRPSSPLLSESSTLPVIPNHTEITSITTSIVGVSHPSTNKKLSSSTPLSSTPQNESTTTTTRRTSISTLPLSTTKKESTNTSDNESDSSSSKEEQSVTKPQPQSQKSDGSPNSNSNSNLPPSLSKEETLKETTPDYEYKINDKVYVEEHNLYLYHAIVKGCRYLDPKKKRQPKKKKGKNKKGTKNNDNDNIEYKIHYHGFAKRFDKWWKAEDVLPNNQLNTKRALWTQQQTLIERIERNKKKGNNYDGDVNCLNCLNEFLGDDTAGVAGATATNTGSDTNGAANGSSVKVNEKKIECDENDTDIKKKKKSNGGLMVVQYRFGIKVVQN